MHGSFPNIATRTLCNALHTYPGIYKVVRTNNVHTQSIRKLYGCYFFAVYIYIYRGITYHTGARSILLYDIEVSLYTMYTVCTFPLYFIAYRRKTIKKIELIIQNDAHNLLWALRCRVIAYPVLPGV